MNQLTVIFCSYSCDCYSYGLMQYDSVQHLPYKYGNKWLRTSNLCNGRKVLKIETNNNTVVTEQTDPVVTRTYTGWGQKTVDLLRKISVDRFQLEDRIRKILVQSIQCDSYTEVTHLNLLNIATQKDRQFSTENKTNYDFPPQ